MEGVQKAYSAASIVVSENTDMVEGTDVEIQLCIVLYHCTAIVLEHNRRVLDA